MNTTTLNMTTLDGGVIIKKGEGGGATINNQDKVVDITENGTTEVVADGGFTGLGKVTINTEVSGGGESGGSDWRYFDISGIDTGDKYQVLSYAMTFKVQGESIKDFLGAGVVSPVGFAYAIPEIKVEEIKAIGTDYSKEMRIGEMSSKIEQTITTQLWYGQLTEITKEQFYSLD